jgi:hypothetical protein
MKISAVKFLDPLRHRCRICAEPHVSSIIPIPSTNNNISRNTTFQTLALLFQKSAPPIKNTAAPFTGQ